MIRALSYSRRSHDGQEMVVVGREFIQVIHVSNNQVHYEEVSDSFASLMFHVQEDPPWFAYGLILPLHSPRSSEPPPPLSPQRFEYSCLHACGFHPLQKHQVAYGGTEGWCYVIDWSNMDLGTITATTQRFASFLSCSVLVIVLVSAHA